MEIIFFFHLNFSTFFQSRIDNFCLLENKSYIWQAKIKTIIMWCELHSDIHSLSSEVKHLGIITYGGSDSESERKLCKKTKHFSAEN